MTNPPPAVEDSGAAPTAPEITPLSEQSQQNFMDDFLTGEYTSDTNDVTTSTTTPAPTVEDVTTSTTTPAPEVITDEGEGEETVTSSTTAPAPTVEPVDSSGGIDYDKLGDSVAKAIKGNESAPAAPKADPAISLSAKAQRKLTNLKRLEELFPDQYKGLAGKFESSQKAEISYRTQWQTDNPGETYDSDAVEHDTFYDKNMVEYDKDDYLEAVADVRADQRTSQVTRQLEQHQREAELQPRLKEIRKDVRKQVVGEHKDVMEQPMIGDLISAQATYAEDLVSATHSLFSGAAYNPADALHQRVEQMALAAEQDVINNPDRQTDKQGRHFATTQQFGSMTDAQRQRSWTLSADDVSTFAVGLIKSATTEQVKAKRAEFDKYAEAIGLSKGGEAAPKVATPSKPKSPASIAEPKVAATGASGGDSPKNWAEKFTADFIG